MPWRKLSVENERMRFVNRLESGEKMTDLCREFEISRKTGYKIFERYKELGPKGLYDFSRAPIRSPKKTPIEIVKLILDTKSQYPTWGALKLKAYLNRHYPGISIPVRSAIHGILEREGLVKSRSRRRFVPTGTQRTESKQANDVWCTDFKGQFRLRNKQYCYPLTITDHFSRYLLCCEALENTQGQPVIEVFSRIFSEYGLPTAILSDNGPPFGSPKGLLGLSKLAVWLIRQGIRIERIEPGEPQQNGRHERMHSTLKKEATRPPGSNILSQQEKFDDFQKIFNTERPHEALDNKVPSDLYCASLRLFDPADPEPEYPLFDKVSYVNRDGTLYLGGQGERYYIGTAFGGQPIGLREEESGLWLASFKDLELGYIDQSSGIFTARSKLDH